MNLVRQREKLKEAHRRGILTAKQLFAALNAPVFICQPPQKSMTIEEAMALAVPKPEDRAKAMQFLHQHVMCWPQELIDRPDSSVVTATPSFSPFPCFRISLPNEFRQWFHTADRTWTVFRHKDANDVRPERWYLCRYAEDARDCSWLLWEGERQIEVPDPAKHSLLDRTVGDYAATVGHLQRFLFEVLYPGTVLLRVGPSGGASRSVEWRLARTHYLLLTQRDAKACRERRHNPSAHQLARAAHWRMAHVRRLLSERYTHKRGMIVPVKEAWVGPKEWTGLDGKIYKVIERGDLAGSGRAKPGDA